LTGTDKAICWSTIAAVAVVALVSRRRYSWPRALLDQLHKRLLRSLMPRMVEDRIRGRLLR
jgi:hypothetical protein